MLSRTFTMSPNTPSGTPRARITAGGRTRTAAEMRKKSAFMGKPQFLAMAHGRLCAALLVSVSLAACTADPGLDQEGAGTAPDQAAAAASPDGGPPADEALSAPPDSIEIAWTEVSGDIRDVGIGGVDEDQSMWSVGGESVPGGHEINYWNASAWETVSRGAVAIDVAPTGYPWVVDSEGRIFEWTGSSWTERPGRGRDIGIGADGSVWIVGTDPVPGGYGIYRWTETGWDQAPGGAVAIDVYARGDAAVDLQGEPWIVDADNRISRWTGSEWARQPGEAQDIGVGANGAVWIVGTDPADGGYSIATWNGEGWTSASGGGMRISVDADGFPYVVTEEGQLLRGT